MQIDDQLLWFQADAIPNVGKPYIVVEVQTISDMEVVRSRAYLLIAHGNGRLTCVPTTKAACEQNPEDEMPDIRTPKPDVKEAIAFMADALTQQVKGMAERDLLMKQESEEIRHRQKIGEKNVAMLEKQSFSPCDPEPIRKTLSDCLSTQAGRRAFSQMWKASFTSALKDILREVGEIYKNLAKK